MSAFIMDEEFFNQLANELSCRVNSPNDRYKYDIQEFIGTEYNASIEENDDAIQFKCQELLNANFAAVNDRYNQTDVAGFVSKPRGYIKWSPFQLVKYLRCLRYQCSEGAVMDSTIYKDLDKFIGSLSETIIDSLPEYEACQWDYVASTHRVKEMAA